MIAALFGPILRVVIVLVGFCFLVSIPEMAWVSFSQWAHTTPQLHFIPAIPSVGTIRAINISSISTALGIIGYLKLVRPSLVLRKANSPRGDAYGTARFGDGASLAHPHGLILGRRKNTLLRIPGEGHIFTLAPTGAGKGVSTVIPNLLLHPGSALVTDPKGENYLVTARRRREMGQAVACLDPFDTVGGADQFNPLDVLNPGSTSVVSDALRLADMLVDVPDTGTDEMHWHIQAKTILTGVILHVASSAPPALRSLPYVADLIWSSPKDFVALLERMAASDAAFGTVRKIATAFQNKSDKEASGILSTAQTHTVFLHDPRIQLALSRSTFDFAHLKTSRLTTYLVLPPSEFGTFRRWIRLMIGCAVNAVIKESTPRSGRPVEQTGPRTLFLLDEFAHLGALRDVRDNHSLMRGYGVTFWLLVQDFLQLAMEYPNGAWRSFLSNSAYKQIFGVSDLDTAAYYSKSLGQQTVQVSGDQRSRGRTSQSMGLAGSSNTGTSRSTSERGRPLLYADELLRLPPDEEILLIRGEQPLRAQRIEYFCDKTFRGLYDANPFASERSQFTWERPRPVPRDGVVNASIPPNLPPQGTSLSHLDSPQ